MFPCIKDHVWNFLTCWTQRYCLKKIVSHTTGEKECKWRRGNEALGTKIHRGPQCLLTKSLAKYIFHPAYNFSSSVFLIGSFSLSHPTRRETIGGYQVIMHLWCSHYILLYILSIPLYCLHLHSFLHLSFFVMCFITTLNKIYNMEKIKDSGNTHRGI